MNQSLPFYLRPRTVTLRDGTKVTLRPSRKEDLELCWDMFSSLSRDSLQYLPIPFPRERVKGWFETIDYDKVLSILGFVNTSDGVKCVTSASLVFYEGKTYRHKASFGITIHDDYQNLGLGTILTNYLIEIARAKKLLKIDLEVVTHNSRAVKVYERCGYKIEGTMKLNHWNYILEKYGDEYKMGIILD